jgi:hypothetical protein
MTKEEIRKRERELLELTGAICAQKLNNEYFQLCDMYLYTC